MAGGVADHVVDVDRARLTAVVGQLRGHVDGGVVRRDRRGQVGRRHRRPPAGDVKRVGHGQMHVPGDAAARVPPAAGLLVLHHHREHVGRVPVGVDEAGDVVAVARVAVRVVAERLAVEVDVGVLEDAVEVDRDALARHRGRQRERLAVPAQAAGEVAGGVALAGVGSLGDAPVVGKRELLPAGVVKAGGVRLGVGRGPVRAAGVGGVSGVDELETPASVEVERARAVVEHAEVGIPRSRTPAHRAQIAGGCRRRLRGRGGEHRKRTRQHRRRDACRQPESHLRLPLPFYPGDRADTPERVVETRDCERSHAGVSELTTYASHVPLDWLAPTELRIGLGCMRLSTDDDRDDRRAHATIAAATEAGITVFDTARAYGRDATEVGHNERLLAAALGESGHAGAARIVTKGGMTREGGAWVPDGRAKRDPRRLRGEPHRPRRTGHRYLPAACARSTHAMVDVGARAGQTRR